VVMVTDTVQIRGGQITLSGKDFTTFLDQRPAKPTHLTDKPGNMIGTVISMMVLQSGQIFGEEIPRFRVGALTQAGNDVTEDISRGGAYSAVAQIAQKYDIGMRVLLEDLVSGGVGLVFETYVGVDRTSTQDARNLVRFSPDLETLADVRDVRSNAMEKNVVRAYPPDNFSETYPEPVEVTTIKNFGGSPGLQRRVLEIVCDDITEEMLKGTTMEALLRTRAAKALGENRRTRIVDGELVPRPGYIFGKDFFLGDRVEIEGEYGSPVTGTITEYIRSKDDTGSRSYPTVADAGSVPQSTDGPVTAT